MAPAVEISAVGNRSRCGRKENARWWAAAIHKACWGHPGNVMDVGDVMGLAGQQMQDHLGLLAQTASDITYQRQPSKHKLTEAKAA
jgi:hypothetical protein